MNDAMQLFSKPVSTWFTQTMGQPTHTQEMGWPVLSKGKHTLVCAPTGTGKTLCAFLLSIEHLLKEAQEGKLTEGVRVLYISPLKALGNDIACNLDVPLEGIASIDPAALSITKMVRTGDTTTAERRRMVAHPPHILITTPESLYLLLTSQAGKRMFASLQTVIIDEIHAMLETKRGTHLTLSLERLARIATFQRIGLTATVEPMQEAASFLGGAREVSIVDARQGKKMDLLIECPTEDFGHLPEGTIWPEIAKKIDNYAMAQRQTLVFCNSRMVSENVTAALNRLHGKEASFAAAHHGSMDKQSRLSVEKRFKSGELRCLCATSSMELGIDVGSIDLVIQVGSPKSAARGLQRAGRAGHRPGDTSCMRILVRTPQDALETALVGRAMLDTQVEPMKSPRLCLDVLAQHIVSMACQEVIKVEELYDIVRGSFAYRDLTLEDLLRVLKMLRGDFEHAAGRDLRPRIVWDEIQGTVTTDAYGRLLAVSGSTIPDRGYYPVVTPEGTRLGELDEEFVYEARIGDRFMLGAFTWGIVRIQHDRVVVVPSGGSARAPFWKGEVIGRPSKTGEMYGREMTQIQSQSDLLTYLLERFPIDLAIARSLKHLLEEQIRILGCLPTDRRLVVEHFQEEAGECFVAVHCLLGGRVNQALAIVLHETASRMTGRDVHVYHSDDGILMHFVGADVAPKGLIEAIDPQTIRAILLRSLPSTPLFAITFRQAAAVALMLSGQRAGKRTPLWVQRLQGAQALSRAAELHDHPLIIESYRACMERVLEVDRAIQLIQEVHKGLVEVVEVNSEFASPLTKELKAKLIEVYTYQEALPQDVAAKGALASEDAVMPLRKDMQKQSLVSAKDERDLYAQLLKRGTMARSQCFAIMPLVEQLTTQEKACWLGDLLVASHERDNLSLAIKGDTTLLSSFLLRYIRAMGEVSTDMAKERFGDHAVALLDDLANKDVLSMYQREEGAFFALVEDARRALVARVREKRASIATVEPSAYAALLPIWQKAMGGISSSRIEEALSPLYGLYIHKDQWESMVLPARVNKYRASDLDQFLLSGGAIWRLKQGEVAFYPPDQPMSQPEDTKDDPVYGALLEAGALFTRQIAQRSGITGAELEKNLQDLVASGLVVSDGFACLRHLQMPDNVKQQVRVRSMALSGMGRWEAAGKPIEESVEDQLRGLFTRWGIVSRECVAKEGLSWPPLLECLRRMEFREEVRRGYFVRGMAGAQFVLSSQFAKVVAMLQEPEGAYVLGGSDPAQAYGSILPNAGFHCLPSVAVVLAKGVPSLIAERRGEVLRIPDGATKDFASCVLALANAFEQKRIWPDKNRITVKHYPPDEQDALLAAKFKTDMLDFTLWRETLS